MHEGAIKLIDGKAKLVRDDFCDGLGDCLPSCPVNAITFVTKEAMAYDEEKVKEAKKGQCSCPTSNTIKLSKTIEKSSELLQWSIQIKLVPVNASFFDDKDLLIAADCTAYAFKDFHNTFMKNRITIIGCPKLDSIDYSLKLEEIFKNNNIKSITLTKMDVPCCNGIENAVKRAILNSGKDITLQSITIFRNGKISN